MPFAHIFIAYPIAHMPVAHKFVADLIFTVMHFRHRSRQISGSLQAARRDQRETPVSTHS